VEQDLVIERSIIELFSEPYINTRLAFRGGTALHKIFLKPQARYSEDIDLVQIKSEPIKDTLSVIRKRLDFLGKPTVRQKANNNTMVFRFESEIPPVINLRLKIEINCREHFCVLGYENVEYRIQNTWANGSCMLTTYRTEELLATKLRALYQCKKGRDLFDLYHALSNLNVDKDLLMECYKAYMSFTSNHLPSQHQFLCNLEDKLKDPDFNGDIYALLRPGVTYEPLEAFELLRTELIERM